MRNTHRDIFSQIPEPHSPNLFQKKSQFSVPKPKPKNPKHKIQTPDYKPSTPKPKPENPHLHTPTSTSNLEPPASKPMLPHPAPPTQRPKLHAPTPTPVPPPPNPPPQPQTTAVKEDGGMRCIGWGMGASGANPTLQILNPQSQNQGCQRGGGYPVQFQGGRCPGDHQGNPQPPNPTP